MTASVLRGKLALTSQGIRYCKMQIRSACTSFKRCIGDAAKEAELLSEQAIPDEPAGSDSDSEFGSEETVDFQELVIFSDASSSDNEEEYSD